MPRRLPPLKAFEAAQHESFTRAANELCVTWGAVSHQVKALEAGLGSRLAVPYGYWIVGPKAISGLPKVVACRDRLLWEAPEDARRLREILA